MQPVFQLNLTSASLDSRVTFARAGNTATRINSSGFVEAVNADIPRFDHSPITSICRGLLVEESRQNAFLWSQDFTKVANWGIQRVSVSGSLFTSPRNTSTANKVEETATTGSHYIAQALSAGSSVARTASVWLKAGERNFAWLSFDGANGIFFNLTTGGTTGSFGTAPSHTIEFFQDGWIRYSLTATTTARTLFIGLSNDGTAISYAGSAGSGIYVFGGQLEAGAFATSYIPTTTAAVTRNADVATITGTAFSGFWRSGPGSILVRALPSTVSGTRPLVQVDDATADNIIALRGNTTNPELYIRAGGSDQATIDAGTISAAAYRLAGAWQAGSAAASLNSGLAVNGAPASIPAVTQMRLGSNGTNYLNGHLQAVEYYDVRLSNASLQTVSSTAGYQSIIQSVLKDTIVSDIITEPV